VGDSILWKYWLVWALFALPAVPLVYAVRRVRAGPRAATVVDLVPLVIASLSTVWLDAAVANWSFLGPLYGWLHYAIIGGNLIADLLCALLAFAGSLRPGARARRLAAGLACLMLAAEWAAMGIINR
jgi:hypothetical protein